jgi:hypothetical protein
MKYVRSWLDKKTGRTYAFFRRRGYSSVRLPGLIGSPEFMAAYHAALRGEQPAAAVAEMTARTGPGTINAAVALYLDSNAFMQFGKSTRALRRSILKKFCELPAPAEHAVTGRRANLVACTQAAFAMGHDCADDRGGPYRRHQDQAVQDGGP